MLDEGGKGYAMSFGNLLRNLESATLHAVCVGYPNADLDSIRERTTHFLGEEVDFSVLGVTLTKLKKDGLIWTEKRPDNGAEKVYVFPTQTGRAKDKTYSAENQSNNQLTYSAAPSL